MISRSSIAAVLRNGRTVLTDLRSEAPLAFRPTNEGISMIASAGGPVGGDQVSIEVDVGADASLDVAAIGATLTFPGPVATPSTLSLRIHVGPGGRLRWQGLPLLPVTGCDHRQCTHITLDSGARLDFTEEIALGRTGEPPGRLDTRLRVEREGRPLLHDHQFFDAASPGWSTTARAGRHRHIVQRLVVGPEARPTTTTVDEFVAHARMRVDTHVTWHVTSAIDRCRALERPGAP